MKKKTKMIVITWVSVLTLIACIAGATYAYFVAQAGSGTSANINATTGTTDSLTFEPGKSINIHADMENFLEGMESRHGETTATATLKANNTTNQASAKYNVFFIIDNNDFEYTTSDKDAEIILKVTDPNGNEVETITGLRNVEGGFDITTRTGGFLIASNYEIEATPTEPTKNQTWKAEVTFVNLDKDQNANKGKTLIGRLYITTETEETYQLAHINSIETNISYNSIEATLNYDKGNAEIDKYYYKITEQTEAISYVDNSIRKLATAQNALTGFEESTNSTFVFTNLKYNTTYLIEIYAIDKNGIRSNIYSTTITTGNFTAAQVDKVEITGLKSRGFTINATATKGTNDIVKYMYSLDDGQNYEEIDEATYVAKKLLPSTEYKIKVKVKDSDNRDSADYTINVTTLDDLRLNNYTFAWDEVEEATKYNVYSDNTLIASTTSTTIELWKKYKEPGVYDIKVASVDSTNKETFLMNNIDYDLKRAEPTTPTSKTIDSYDITYYKGPGIAVPEGATKINWILYEQLGVYDLDAEVERETAASALYNAFKDNIDYCEEHSDACVTYNLDSFDETLNYCYIYDKLEISSYPYNHTYYFKKTTTPELALNYDKSKNEILVTRAPSGYYNVTGALYGLQYIVPGYLPSSWFYGYMASWCLDENTLAYVYDRKKKKFKKKKLKDLTYNDEILVWDFDNGVFTTAKPLWIAKTQVADQYNELKFSNGSILRTLMPELGHRIFNKEKGAFTYPMTEDTPLGTTTFSASGEDVKLVDRKIVNGEIRYTNIITEYHMNLFTNDILTSCRLNNLYPIKDMKFVKDNRKLKTPEECPNIAEKWFKSIRVAEQPEDINRNNARHWDDLESYINDRENGKK